MEFLIIIFVLGWLHSLFWSDERRAKHEAWKKWERENPNHVDAYGPF